MTDATTAASEPCQAVGAPVEQPVRLDPERWYCVGREGRATLCTGVADAIDEVRMQDVGYPLSAPHRAMVLGDLTAERERWELHLSAVRKLAEANSKRGDDCGMLARTLLDTLKAMKA